MKSFTWFALGVLTASASITATLFASPGVPEIDPASVSAGIGLLAAGVMILRSRRRSK